MTQASEQTEQRDLFALYLLAKRIANEAGNLIHSLRFPVASSTSTSTSTSTTKLQIDQKSNSTDLVTTADIASQHHIFAQLRKHCPNDRFLGEEDGSDHGPLDATPTWIVDAIDGTTNFVHGLHDVAICIALAIDKRVVLGVVHNPMTHETFSALRGYGAYCNNDRIRLANDDDDGNDAAVVVTSPRAQRLRDALVLSEWGYERSPKGVQAMLAFNQRLLLKGVRAVRQLGSGALDLCYVAMGRADAVVGGIAHMDTWHIWDYAAASIVAEEAGAVFRTVDGGAFTIESDSLVCCTPAILQELLDTIQPTPA